jgi:hypothetical protein
MANTKITLGNIADDAVGLDQLNISNSPSGGQALTYVASSNDLQWATISGGVDGISSSADATAITIDSSERVGVGTTSPDFLMDIEGSNTQLKVGTASQDGGFLTSTDNNQLIASGGFYYDGSNFIATATSASGVSFDNGDTVFYNNSNLTDGNSFTLKETVRIEDNGNFRFNYGTGNLGNRYITVNSGSGNDGGFILERENTNKWQITANASNDDDLWFYSYGTSSAVLKLDRSTGAILAPKQPAFGGARNAGHKADGNVYVADYQRTNDDSHYNTTNGRFTAPVTGRYYVFGNIMTHDSGSAGHINWSIRKNGSNILYAYDYKDGATHSRCVGAWVIPLTANDYIEWYLNEDSGAGGWYGSAHEYGSIGAFLIG